MDHRISKDMISSGMIPSGEKKQEDLGKTQYGTVPSPNALSDVYKKMYETKEEVINEHHKKDADGNTIPHEGEELNEVSKKTLGSYVKKASTEIGTSAIKGDYKKMKKRHKGVLDASDKMVKEEIDTYDIVLDHFLNEGYEREDIIKVMSTVHLTEEPITATLALIGGKLAAGAAKVAAGGMKAAKAVGTATKPLATKSASQFGKVNAIAKAKPMTTGGFKEPLKKVTQGSLDLKGEGGMSPDTPSSVATGRMSPQRSSSKNTGQLVGDEIKRQAVAQTVNKTMSGGGGEKKQRTGTVSASADLFDIVKGQLLDEGLSEEEIKDIMLTLTPDEILSEMGMATPEAGTGKYYNEKNPTDKQKEIQKNLPQNKKPTPDQQSARDKYAKIKDMTNKGDHQGASKLYNS